MAAKKTAKTVTVQDRNGTDVEVPVGLDGKNPVSVNNPNPKAFLMEADVDAQMDFLKSDAVQTAGAPDNESNA